MDTLIHFLNIGMTGYGSDIQRLQDLFGIGPDSFEEGPDSPEGKTARPGDRSRPGILHRHEVGDKENHPIRIS